MLHPTSTLYVSDQESEKRGSPDATDIDRKFEKQPGWAVNQKLPIQSNFQVWPVPRMCGYELAV